MAYCLFMYFNWVPALIVWWINRKRRDSAKGIYFILAGTALELISFIIHSWQWSRVRGEPDQLYVWIFPLLISAIGIVFILIGTIRSFTKFNTQEIQTETKGA